MFQANISMLNNTLSILEQGYYLRIGGKVKLKLSRAQMKKTDVYLPEDIRRIKAVADIPHMHVLGRTGVSCENTDSFTLAHRQRSDFPHIREKGTLPVLVLNLANPVNPGGGVRRGTKAQEEDLCRRSSLLLSLESEAAREYYEYNRSLETYMGSDAIMITPQVEIIKDEKGVLLPESEVVAVMTCAAPKLTFGMEGLSEQQYRDMVGGRITGMLELAAHLGYRFLVLGAFGCGAFDNDAAVISDLFYEAMKKFDRDGRKLKDCFERIDFAVLDNTPGQYNFREFARNFSDFYREEKVLNKTQKEKQFREKYLDKIRGCLFGGAAGDALGYPVEFLTENSIFTRYGEKGIQTYELINGKALISDDTQMTLFTANGILNGDTRLSLHGTSGYPRSYIAKAYFDWLKTQSQDMKTVIGHERRTKEGGFTWLLDVSELYAYRAPGGTCLSGLEERQEEDTGNDFIKNPINHSKGCGGIMRVAPLALRYQPGETYPSGIEDLDMEAAQTAAITHSHSLGYMPAAAAVHVISRCITASDTMTLKEMVLEARDTVAKLFAENENVYDLIYVMNKAVELSENNAPDLDNIHELGEGWVAEETLGIALYCALKYQNDFSKAVTVAVNHNGDSDSTGAVTGNIVGALLGYGAIEDKWKKDLELADVILELADDLCRDCPLNELNLYEDCAWSTKYVSMHRYQPTPTRPAYTFFWKADEENGEFSNWYPRPFVIDDFEYLFVEQYMMAQKARLFHDSKRYTQILRAQTPRQCKDLGKQVTPFDPAAWDAVKYEVVKTGNRAKYEQNPDLLTKLLATGNSILAEASKKDDIWGIAMKADIAAVTDPKQWPGQNLLGKLLMELREELGKKE